MAILRNVDREEWQARGNEPVETDASEKKGGGVRRDCWSSFGYMEKKKRRKKTYKYHGSCYTYTSLVLTAPIEESTIKAAHKFRTHSTNARPLTAKSNKEMTDRKKREQGRHPKLPDHATEGSGVMQPTACSTLA